MVKPMVVSFVTGALVALVAVVLGVFVYGEPVGAWIMARGAQLRAAATIPVEHPLAPEEVVLVTRAEPTPAKGRRR